jgi:hypothetical protein
MENWKSVIGYEGIYEVSDLGNIKSLSRKLFNSRGFFISQEKILKKPIDNNGYCCVSLRKDKILRIRRVHQLVAEAFLNHKPDGTHRICVDHINNIKTDNDFKNLQLISHRENSSKDRKNNSSKYVGVCWVKDKKKWKSAIWINQKHIHLGHFETELEAHNIYQNKLNKIVYEKCI